MQKYTHLFNLMPKQQNSLTNIAKLMNRSVSTISRKIKPNTGKRDDPL